jgi:cold shock CspA family protein
MPTGRVKTFNAERGFGFVTSESGEELYVAAAETSGELRPGDVVDFEVADAERGRRKATGVTVTQQAPEGNPVGRTMTAPPSWDELEERERQRRMARRRRR